jgi:phosphoribosylamine--glycine ligase
MRVLVIGSGGREHALAWKLRQSPHASRLFCAPGNVGIAEVAELVPIGVDQIGALREFAAAERIDLTVVGPEAPLAAGLADAFRERGLRVFGPGAAAARIESSKLFAKQLMARAAVPTASYARFTQLEPALAHLDRLSELGVRGVVIKADGLAAGKGVIVADTMDEARDAARRMLAERAFGAAGDVVVIEERLLGEEASLLVLASGTRDLPFLPAQDYKRVGDGDAGPNTGGMGSYAPAPVITPERFREAMERIVRPTLAQMAAEGHPYQGCLYAGLMSTDAGLQVIEFNGRFGDPETQALLPLLETDLLELMLATVEDRLEEVEIQWRPGACVCVVMAAPGYPDDYPKGLPIEGLEQAAALPGVHLFHAGTARQDGRVVTAGGRVLGVTAHGPDFAEARRRVYEAVRQIHFEGAHYRTDIAARAADRGSRAET